MPFHLFFFSGGRSIKENVRVNRAIRSPQIRLINDEGVMLGVTPIHEALKMTEERGYDLVEVASNVVPPVCRMMDFGQYKYELTKKQKEAKKKQKIIKLKEVKVRPKTDEGDLQTKSNQIRKFLEEGDKVKVTVFFRGRERAHMDMGYKVVIRMKEILADDLCIEKDVSVEGNTLSMILQPPKKTTKT
ncbi:MAG: translation initiation factor IF-3 [Candidatus Riflebacteria bacterium]|nr:translation initiation factor IF-3 [Candidatus Riflebacteria bacterium]